MTTKLSLLGPPMLLLKACFWLACFCGCCRILSNDFTCTTYNGSTITITGYNGTNSVVAIPEMINGMQVTGIGIHAFSWRTWIMLTSVTIPNSVTNIEAYAFYRSRYLTNIVLGNSVITIGEGAFAECTGLANVTIPDSVTSIGNEAFDSCTNLSVVTFGNRVSRIGTSAFLNCRSLSTVTIPDSVTTIGDSAFFHCTRLANITVGNSVTNIGTDAFSLCTNLTWVYFLGSAPSFYYWAFAGCFKATIYYLPTNTGWNSTYAGRPTALWRPQIQMNAGFGVRNNQYGFNITWASGQVVVVETTANLDNPGWVPITTNVLTSGVSYFSDSQWTNYPGRFYRLRSP